MVCDLEATCWRAEDDPELAAAQRSECEIIEIGALRLDPYDLSVVDRFERFVRPERHPELSAFCSALTHIQQAQVDAAEPFPEAWAAFRAWLGEDPSLRFAAWGHFDPTQLTAQAAAAGLAPPAWVAVDVKRDFAEWCRWTGRPKGRHALFKALEILALPPGQSPHRALSDADDVARVLRIIRDPTQGSPEACRVLQVLAAHDPEPIQRRHVADVDPKARGWFERAVKELRRSDAVYLSASRAYLALAPRGRAALAQLAEELSP